jgi:hypothetical protein
MPMPARATRKGARGPGSLPVISLGVRGALATVLASLVARALRLDRPYWVELTAVVLVNETWRESMQKGVERVLATALGCVVGATGRIATAVLRVIDTGIGVGSRSSSRSSCRLAPPRRSARGTSLVMSAFITGDVRATFYPIPSGMKRDRGTDLASGRATR